MTPPFASVLSRNQKHRRCSRCFKTFDADNPTMKRLRCTGCPADGASFYCSRECQVADFVTHRHECKKKGTKSLSYAVQTFTQVHGEDGITFPLDEYWLARKTYHLLMFNAKSDGGDISGLVPPLPASLANLVENALPEDAVLAECVAASVCAVQKGAVAESQRADLVKFFASLLAKFRANNFGVLSDLQNCIGSAVYQVGAILNHSCAPNCVLVYGDSTDDHEEQVQKIVVIEDIKEGSELCHSYVELCQPTAARRSHLLSNYGFECSCPKCEVEQLSGEER